MLEILRSRLASGSKPGERDDDARVALAIEGGGSRGAYSNGMAAVVDELGLTPCFDAVYGSSAGSLTGAWLLGGQVHWGEIGWGDPRVMRGVTNPWRGLMLGPVVDTAHLVHTVYEAVPMNFDAIVASPIEFHPLATAGDTGEVFDLYKSIVDKPSLQRSLRASTGLPLLSGRPVRLDGRIMLDAGLIEQIPYRSALAQGATHVLVLRTRAADDQPGPPSPMENRVVLRYLNRVAPGAVPAWLGRLDRHREDEKVLAEHPGVLQIRPADGTPHVSRLSRNTRLLARAVGLGRHAARLVLQS
ncbi:putative patatin/cPLA2 family phospholipase [Labedaea rhizosphaerae]|uniref:Putative patatin/cPLA2 family phospholipase n=1 Tax=Labedaea rhizosphaerae TaxID=598644 RepID=A0A4R6SMQ7_LABRH|nr:putative patatin/cPLA2 family phospholipase [Labedaea rhizosphaerae]